MNKTILAKRIQNLEEEMTQLQTIKNTKQAQINQIQTLFLQASIALQALAQANKSLPQPILPYLSEQIYQLFSESHNQGQKGKRSEENNTSAISLSSNDFNGQRLTRQMENSLPSNGFNSSLSLDCRSSSEVKSLSKAENLLPSAVCRLTNFNPIKLWEASDGILPLLSQGKTITNKQLQAIMIEVYGGDDSQGYWQWKTAYEALEIALVRHIRLIGQQPHGGWCMMHVQELENSYPTHTRRSAESITYQQFSTPLPLGCVAKIAAQLSDKDMVLESSAGNGLLAVWAENMGASLILNEMENNRNTMLSMLFPDAHLFRHNGETIHDTLPSKYQPTVALLNPPFTASPNVHKRHSEATFQHLYSALQRLPIGGRLVAITANWFSPLNPKWQEAFSKIEQLGTVVFSVGIEGEVYRKQGTSIETRLTVIDKGQILEDSKGVITEDTYNISQLLQLVNTRIPPRLPIASSSLSSQANTSDKPEIEPLNASQPKDVTSSSNVISLPQSKERENKQVKAENQAQNSDNIVYLPQTPTQIQYQPKTTQNDQITDALYQTYQPQTIDITGAKAHPTTLVQSAAMASVKPPLPSYQPTLPIRLITQGILSSAQLESIIYAGEAHSQYLAGHYLIDKTMEKAQITNAEDENGIKIRKGWLLGDGTGAGKGRQAAGIIMDNWQKGRTKAVWISKSDKLVEDAKRDWEALGGNKDDIIPLGKISQGKEILQTQGILFATYALLRVKAKKNKISRIQQIINWLGEDSDAVIIFDECHAMGGAIASQGSRGVQKPSQQGLAGLRLQYGLPNARVVYVSATGASKVSNLAYAVRLGLWQTTDIPFKSPTDFISSVERGGLAAMEVVSRDLKSLGLYLSRSLSYEGVEYDILEHELTDKQIEIYDAYANAYQIIHHNIDEALKATRVISLGGEVRNSQAKANARSAFESSKQRFFNHLLTAMKMPTVLKAMERDIDAGNAIIIQIVSTNEALLDRRLAEIPVSEWNDLNIDVTPREYILDYLNHAFPVQLHEVYSDSEGNLHSKPMYDDDGNPILSQEALAKRDELIESLALIPPIQGTLDQIIHHFGHQKVAEVTGRSKRIIRDTANGKDVLKVNKRPATANRAEINSFMNDEKPILIFSDAGGTGLSFHAALNAKNQRQRIHYLLEAGWRADNAIQGLGRSHRSHQKQPPIFRPVTTNVKGEKRFLSTIAKRLDALGALTKGQRETGSQGIFREEDNFDSLYARTALNQLYHAIYRGQLLFCSLSQFQDATGLSLESHQGGMKAELPTMNQFLNRLLALPVDLQNQLFEAFEMRLEQNIEDAKNNGSYEVGVETLKAHSLEIIESQVIYTHSFGQDDKVSANGADSEVKGSHGNEETHETDGSKGDKRDGEDKGVWEDGEDRGDREENHENSPSSYYSSAKNTLQSSISTLQSPITNLQSSISTLHSPISTLQSPISNPQSHSLQTICHRISRKEKAQILGVEEALKLVAENKGQLLHNTRSGNVCIAISTNSVLEEDGSVSPRVNLIRPQSNEKIRQSQIDSSYWQVISEDTWRELWQKEVEKTNPFIESQFYLITGLLLPIWNHIDTLNMRVWRMQTDDGQNLLGRMVPTNIIGDLFEKLGINAPQFSAEEIYHAVNDNHKTMTLGNWEIRSNLVSGKRRLEVTGFQSKAESDYLKTMGCFSEMIQWRLRIFIPNNDNAIPIIEKLMKA